MSIKLALIFLWLSGYVALVHAGPLGWSHLEVNQTGHKRAMPGTQRVNDRSAKERITIFCWDIWYECLDAKGEVLDRYCIWRWYYFTEGCTIPQTNWDIWNGCRKEHPAAASVRVTDQFCDAEENKSVTTDELHPKYG